MKNISLPNKELQALSGQLQNFNAGYTVPQIRSLDKVVRIMEENLKPFTEGLDKFKKTIISQVSPEEKAKEEEKLQKDLEEYLKTEGEKKITCSFEDVDFEFIKMVWSKMVGLRGDKGVREIILKIDDAINNATAPVFSNGESQLKEIEKPQAN